MNWRRKKVAIVGGGNQGKAVQGILQRQGREVWGFIDDNPGRGIMSVDDAFLNINAHEIMVAIGDNKTRAKLFRGFKVAHQLTNAIDPSALISRSAIIAGKNCMIHPHAFIGDDSMIWDNVIVNTGVIVEHDVVVGDHVHLAPGAVVLGRAMIREGAFIGGGAVIRDGVTVHRGAMVGMGSVVTRDVPPGQTWCGNPAREMK